MTQPSKQPSSQPSKQYEAASQTSPRRLFVIGANRSGTTWLQLLLAQHPRIATTQEPQLFGAYLATLERKWLHQSARGEGERKAGLPSVLSREEFVRGLRLFSAVVFDAIRAARPDAELLLYKGVRTEAPLVHEIEPEAWFIHIVRDPRAVAASMRAASQGFGRKWAPSSLATAAETWADAVRVCRSLRDLTPRYREIRYRDLTANTAERLAEMFEWLGVPLDEESTRRAVEACRFDSMKDGSFAGSKPWDVGSEPKDFFRQGTPDGWRADLTSADVALVEYIAGDLLDDYKFERTTPAGGPRPASLVRWERRRRASSALRRIGERVAIAVEGLRP